MLNLKNATKTLTYYININYYQLKYFSFFALLKVKT